MAAYQNVVNCQLIQIILYTENTLSEYYAKVKGKKQNIVEILDLPYDFSDRCPVCGGRDCAKFLDYYLRGVVDENGTYYKSFPVARFLCNRKGSEQVTRHKTFSLLPYQLIPYTKYSLPFIIKVLKLRYIEDRSIYKLQEYLAAVEEANNIYLDLSVSRIYWFKQLALECIDKILAAGYYKEAGRELQQPSQQERIKRFIEFTERFHCWKIKPYIRGPCALSYDYYMEGGGYFRNIHFLFGTASQFRTL